MMDERGGFRRHRHGPGRMRRGDVRTAVLAVLTEQSGHGYEIIQALEDKSGGAWRPSPGSIYPTLQMLEDEGLVRSTEREGKRTFEITDEGRAEAERRLDEAGGPPWANGYAGNLWGEFKLLALAVKQVQVAAPTHQEKATEIIASARKQLYRLLADD